MDNKRRRCAGRAKLQLPYFLQAFPSVSWSAVQAKQQITRPHSLPKMPCSESEERRSPLQGPFALSHKFSEFSSCFSGLRRRRGGGVVIGFPRGARGKIEMAAWRARGAERCQNGQNVHYSLPPHFPVRSASGLFLGSRTTGSDWLTASKVYVGYNASFHRSRAFDRPPYSIGHIYAFTSDQQLTVGVQKRESPAGAAPTHGGEEGQELRSLSRRSLEGLSLFIFRLDNYALYLGQQKEENQLTE